MTRENIWELLKFLTMFRVTENLKEIKEFYLTRNNYEKRTIDSNTKDKSPWN